MCPAPPKSSESGTSTDRTFPNQPAAYRFVGRWASDVRLCSTQAWRFTASSLRTAEGKQCALSKVSKVAGGYDIAARCAGKSSTIDDTLKLRFAESAKALLFESRTIADMGLVGCP
jgi:hypothetical protein